MNVPIKTNQLTYTFDKELFSKNYDIFCIRTSEKYFKNGAYIIDAPLLSNNVCSVLFKSGKEIFVLMKSNDTNISFGYILFKKYLNNDIFQIQSH